MNNKLKIGSRCRVVGFGFIQGGRIAKVIIEIGETNFAVEYQNGERSTIGIGNLELLKPSLDTLFVGDVVVDKNRDEQIVLAVIGEAVLLSYYVDNDTTGDWLTVKELKKLGYTLKESSVSGADTEEMKVNMCSRTVSYSLEGGLKGSGCEFKNGECVAHKGFELIGERCSRGTVGCEILHSNCEALRSNIEPCLPLKGSEEVCKTCGEQDNNPSMHVHLPEGSEEKEADRANDTITMPNGKKYNLEDVVERVKSLKEIK